MIFIGRHSLHYGGLHLCAHRSIWTRCLYLLSLEHDLYWQARLDLEGGPPPTYSLVENNREKSWWYYVIGWDMLNEEILHQLGQFLFYFFQKSVGDIHCYVGGCSSVLIPFLAISGYASFRCFPCFLYLHPTSRESWMVQVSFGRLAIWCSWSQHTWWGFQQNHRIHAGRQHCTQGAWALRCTLWA